HAVGRWRTLALQGDFAQTRPLAPRDMVRVAVPHRLQRCVDGLGHLNLLHDSSALAWCRTPRSHGVKEFEGVTDKGKGHGRGSCSSRLRVSLVILLRHHWDEDSATARSTTFGSLSIRSIIPFGAPLDSSMRSFLTACSFGFCNQLVTTTYSRQLGQRT